MFKKKAKIEEPKPLTAKDIKNLKEKLSEKEDLSDLKIKDLNLEDIIPQSFKYAVINKDSKNKITLYLHEGVVGDKFKTFRKSNGGIFHKDVLNWSRGKDHGKYVLVEGKGERKIVRLIEDEELLLFQTLRLIKGIIKDKPFMILRELDENEKLTNSKRYIEKNSEHLEVEEVMNIQPVVKDEEDDHEINITSVSLFDE